MIETIALHWSINLLMVQGLMGGFDTVYHHELTVALPRQPGARLELAIHAIRAVLYGLLFCGIAHFAFHGAWVYGIAALVLVEVLLTLWDFVVEDNSRKLPSTERVLHTLLAINGGAVFALYGMQLAQWSGLPTRVVPLDHGWPSWVLTVFAIGVAASGVRDAIAALRLHRQFFARPAEPRCNTAPRSSHAPALAHHVQVAVDQTELHRELDGLGGIGHLGAQ